MCVYVHKYVCKEAKNQKCFVPVIPEHKAYLYTLKTN